MKNKFAKRFLSALLSLAMLLPLFPILAFPAKAASVTSVGMDPVTSTEVQFMDGIYYELSRTTRYNGNRSYTVQVDISANLSHYDHARVRTASQNGYITIEETGYYLLELWGGKGAEGGIGLTGAILIPLPTPGGNAGAAGYVYGKVFLKEGQTLAFNIGTNGTKSTVYNDGSGGVNGDGGTHGEEGSYTVGAGGGYSAIYLFEKGEFKEEYVSPDSFNIPENVRLTRHLMIAGGGGGGGAGLGGTLPTLADNGSPPSAPSGGAGGNINRGVSMSLLGDDYDVPGYVFSGRNGLSSGTDSTWVGRGGSNVPGAIPSTMMGMFDASRLPNDWTGTYYDSSAAGAGGSGNFRGGGGGSGYAGGSGGLMKAQLLASHIGGGGGGSSFIADEVNGEKIEFLDLTADEMSYLSGAARQPVGAETGGAVQISYLKSEDDTFYETALDHITLTGSVSKYFEIVESSSSVSQTGTISVNTLSDGSSQFTVSDISIRPVRPNSSGKTARVTLRLRAKADFMGGNSVPFVSGIQASFLSPNDNATTLTFTPVAEIKHHTVNVPLLEKMQTKSYTSSTEGKSYATTDLYVDDYSSVRSSLSSCWQYAFVSAISTYYVWQYNKQTDSYTQVTSSTVAPVETTNYEVRYDVTPLYEADSAVLVGPPISNPYTVKGQAVISVVAPGSSVLNGLSVTGAKNLSYNNGAYTFSTAVNQESTSLTIGGQTSIIGIDDDPTWTAPADGWYYVEAWGGNGGRGGTVSFSWNYQWYNWGWKNTSGSTSRAGGTGGQGGNVSTYLYLQQGQSLTVDIGSVGTTGSADSDSASEHTEKLLGESGGGGGGNPTTIYFAGSTVLIAGGGGGGGGTAFAAKTAQFSEGLESIETKTGLTGNKPSTTNTTLTGTFAGGAGGNASASWPWTGKDLDAGSAGKAGVNYKNPDFGTTQNGYTLSTAAQKYAQETIDTPKSGTNGQVAITLIENEDLLELQETVKGLETKVAFTRYFDVDAVDLSVGTSYTSKSSVNNDDGSTTVTYTHSTYGQIAKFTYKTETGENDCTVVTIYDFDYALNGKYIDTGSGYAMSYIANLDISYTLTPKEGFLGGNDVPVLAYGQTGNQPDTHDGYADYGVKISQGEEFMNLLAANPTDFANVANTVDLTQYLTVQDKTIHLGDSVQKAELYTFTPPTYDEDAWEDDFAHYFVVAPEDETYSPTKTTEYPITVAFAARTDPAEKATIVESVTPQEFTLTATVFVEVPVTSTLTNLISDHAPWTLYGEDFACNITAKDGYLLPDDISITVDGVELTDFTYNSSLGTVQIDGEYVTGPIVINGAAEIQTYDIHFLYAEYDEENGEQIRTKVYTGIAADTVIDWSDIDAIAASVPVKDGYTYVLSYDVDGGLRPQKMPANNLWVYGSYTKNEYLLTVHYKYEDGTNAAKSYENYVVFGEKYDVPSPIVKKGYLPDLNVVSGVMGASPVTVTVTYKASVNTLLILHQKPDGSLIESESYNFETNQTYNVPVKKFDGYTPDREFVTGQMNGDESETVVVIHTPEKYTVTFEYKYEDYTDATLDSDTRLVEFGRNYGYNAADKLHDGLPAPQLAGYTFAGWYQDVELTQAVLDTDMVEIGDRTFYAKWERTKFKLTVRYEFLYEDGDFLPNDFTSADETQAFLVTYKEEVEFGAEYSVTLPVLTGYSAYENFGLNDVQKLEVLTGNMPGQNKLVVITYEINTYTINFMDLSGSHVTYTDAETSSVASDTFDTVWATVQVKHNEAPVYPAGSTIPNHDTTANYTYTFEGWYYTYDRNVYGDRVNFAPEFPRAVAECNYYATYTAVENIVSVTYGTTTLYYTNVIDALATAETNVSSGDVAITFRRNSGNPRELDISDQRLVFGDTYSGTTFYPITVDLNGVLLKTTDGRSILENTQSPLNLTITDNGAGGTLSVYGDGSVTAIQCTTGGLTVNKVVRIEANSLNGDATGILFGKEGSTHTLSFANSAASITVTAHNGIACGIDANGTATVKPAVVRVDGNTSYGVRIADGGALTLSGSLTALDLDGTISAMGIYVPATASFANTVSNSTVQNVVSAQGDAYGIYNEGTLSTLNLKMNVEAYGKAYGLYNKAGTISVTGIYTGTDLRANGAEGYGLYNEKDGVAIGSINGDKLTKGAFQGSTNGIYSVDNNIYAAGNTLYFKGADENSALLGVVHEYEDGKWHITDATTQFEDGYYRLAMMRKITFDTKGGTEIIEVEQLYDTPLEPVETTKRGYTFVTWHKADDDTAYVYPATMPDEDLAIYAEWSLNNYQYLLDVIPKTLTVVFHENYPNTAKTAKNPELTVDRFGVDIPEELKDLTYKNSKTLCVHRGWYTSTTISSGTYVDLSGDMSVYDTDNDGVVHLYGGWYTARTDCYTFEPAGVGTSSDATTQYINSSYSSSNKHYFYYVVPKAGTYNFNLANVTSSTSSSYRKYYYIYKSTSTSVQFSGTISRNSTPSYTSFSLSSLNPGDVILVGFYYYRSSYPSTVYSYVSTSLDLTGLRTYNVQSVPEYVTYDYNVEMGENGVVTLPMADNKGHEDMKFAGWQDVAPVDGDATRAQGYLTEPIIQITPDMVDNVPQWQNGELWSLYSQWEERTWDAYQSPKRDFTTFETEESTTIRGTGTISVRFKSESLPEEALVFKFEKGLPAGTLLTLIDRSGAVPVYYSYTTTELTRELPSTVFAKMGVGAQNFSGYATDVVLQICYRNTTVASTDEIISIYAGDIVPEVLADYSVTPKISQTVSYDASEFSYDQTHTMNVTIPAATGLGLPADYKVFLRVRWDGVNLAPGTRILLNGTEAIVYDGEYAMLDTGLTVADMTAQTTASVQIQLPTMVQNEFEGKTFYYELCIAPDTNAAFGSKVEALLTIVQTLSLKETPSLTVDAVEKTVPAGQILTVSVNSANAQFYLLQQNSDGTFSYSESCATVFENIVIDVNGALSVSEGSLVTDGTFTATVSASAARGKYYLVVKLGDKYERILVKVVS